MSEVCQICHRPLTSMEAQKRGMGKECAKRHAQQTYANPTTYIPSSESGLAGSKLPETIMKRETLEREIDTAEQTLKRFPDYPKLAQQVERLREQERYAGSIQDMEHLKELVEKRFQGNFSNSIKVADVAIRFPNSVVPQQEIAKQVGAREEVERFRMYLGTANKEATKDKLEELTLLHNQGRLPENEKKQYERQIAEKEEQLQNYGAITTTEGMYEHLNYRMEELQVQSLQITAKRLHDPANIDLQKELARIDGAMYEVGQLGIRLAH